MDGPFYKVIESMYKNTTSKVKVDGSFLSTAIRAKKGVRQGDVLSPLLFNLYVNDLIPLLHEPDSSPPSLLHSKLGCLFYADDLMVISTSPEGLQRSLDKIDTYCKKWKLKINLSKSKAMCMSTNGKNSETSFNIGSETIENVKSYPYLGIELTNTGSMKMSQANLSDKSMRALFKLKNTLAGSDIKAPAALKLFDQLIKPIALYGGEIWGADCLNPNTPHDFLKSLSKPICEKVNTSMCRFLLGVHAKSQLSAIRGELGRYPMGVDIALNLILHEKYLLEKPIESVIREAFELSRQLPELNQNKPNFWPNKVCAIRKLCMQRGEKKPCSRKCLLPRIKSMYNPHWQNCIQNERKMRTYILFKTHFSMENYLILVRNDHCKAMAKFRISAHNLAIERGRYARPPTPVNDRICSFCSGNVIEDEYHFLMTCKKTDSERNTLFNSINAIGKNFNSLSDTDKFIFMMTSEDRGEDKILSRLLCSPSGLVEMTMRSSA